MAGLGPSMSATRLTITQHWHSTAWPLLKWKCYNEFYVSSKTTFDCQQHNYTECYRKNVFMAYF